MVQRVSSVLLGIFLTATPFPALAQSGDESLAAEQPQPGREVQCLLRGTTSWYVTDPAPVYDTPESDMIARLSTWAREQGISVAAPENSYGSCYYRATGTTYLTTGLQRDVNGGQVLYERLPAPDGWSRRQWNAASDIGNLATATQRTTLEFQPVRFARQESQQGYQNAAIDVAYRFMVCAGEVHFAYSLDRQSLRHHPDYILATDTGMGNENRVRPDSEPPVPLTFPLDATIETNSYPVRTIADVKDAIAGEALGMDCFSGQSKKIGTVAALVGPSATSEQARAFLETLRLSRIANIPFALTHPRPVDPAVRAEREARERAEHEAREQQRMAALRSEAERLYADMMAKGGGGYINVEPELYPILQQVIAENTARNTAEYEAQLAAAKESEARHAAEMEAYRASVAESERRQAQWRAEVCRITPEQCPRD